MDYAIQLLLPILGGLLLGFWLTQHYGVSPIWTAVLAILGMVGGIAIMYRRFSNPELYRDFKKNPLHKKEIADKPNGIPIEKLDFLYKDHESHPDEDDYKDLDE